MVFQHFRKIDFLQINKSFEWPENERENYRKILDLILDNIDKENITNMEQAIRVLQKFTMFFDFWLVVYVTAKVTKPKLVLETGVSEGYSTYAILRALQGELYSIDVNPNAGWLVSNKKNWHLIVGRTENELRLCLEKINEVDFVCHDSAHNMKIQFEEYKIMWSHLVSGGVLISDDLTHAFKKFTDKKKDEIKETFVIGKKSNRLIGIIIKK